MENGACHTGNYSCFFNKILKDDESASETMNTLDNIYSNIEDRAKNPQENSYTNYLLNEGTDKICKKIGEEATETVIAAKNDNKEDLVGEICDLVYHTLVLMYNKQVSITDIKNLLDERHKKQGNKKKFNVRGDY